MFEPTRGYAHPGFVQTMAKQNRGGPEIRLEKGAEEIVGCFWRSQSCLLPTENLVFEDHEAGFRQ